MYRKILVPVDGSKASNRGLREALKLAAESKCQVLLLHVVDEFVMSITPETVYDASALIDALKQAGEVVLDKSLATARRAGVNAQTQMVECIGRRAADVIVDRAKKWRADLIVIGAHGRRGVRRLVMGSDAEEVVRMSPVPVLLVRESTRTR
ncbi:MAG TPA: universal stress protein [Burkholderiales bacterium]|nr:universal stress protein [Burkholderiales bacterium]